MGTEEYLLQKRTAEGKALGRHEEALEIAREMLADNFPIAQIIKYTKLTKSEIETLY
uniref:hypothetical protein n=1 Tax=Pedobacter schmidteae TaxID=2201271 RepID=UPI0013CEF81F|nr:hypothetical protein [Pedobacter schmidteae]